MFRQIPFSGLRRKVKNVSANQRPGGHLGFPIGPNNINLLEDVEFLLPVKFHQILLSSFREEVEDVKSLWRMDGLWTTRGHNSVLEPTAQVL